MPNCCLKCLSCLCTCIIVTVNNIAVLIGAVFLASGIVLTFGLSWLTSNAEIAQFLKNLSGTLRDLIHADVDIAELARNLGSISGSVGVTFIVIGVVVMVIAFLGCCGGCCKIKPCLIIYAAIVGALFLAQLTVVIIWYADSNILKSAAKGAMESSVKKYTGINSANVESLLQNIVQLYAGCCGVNNGSDFNTLNQNWNREYSISHDGRNFTFNLTYPVTCCKFDFVTLKPWDPFCPFNNTNSNSNHEKGCYSEVFAFFELYFLNFLFAALAGILALQLLLVAGSLVIYSVQPKNRNSSRVRPI